MKKKILLLTVLTMIMAYTPSVLASQRITGCDNVPGFKGLIIDPKIPNTVHTVILVIQIVVPIVLVIFGMLDLFKGVTAQKEDEIKKSQQMFIKRLISAALVFFVIVFVKLIISFAAGGDNKTIMDCADCFLSGTGKSCAVENTNKQ